MTERSRGSDESARGKFIIEPAPAAAQAEDRRATKRIVRNAPTQSVRRAMLLAAALALAGAVCAALTIAPTAADRDAVGRHDLSRRLSRARTYRRGSRSRSTGVRALPVRLVGEPEPPRLQVPKVGDDLRRARHAGSPRALGRLLAAIFRIRRHDRTYALATQPTIRVAPPYGRDQPSCCAGSPTPSIFVVRYGQCKIMMACPGHFGRTVALPSRLGPARERAGSHCPLADLGSDATANKIWQSDIRQLKVLPGLAGKNWKILDCADTDARADTLADNLSLCSPYEPGANQRRFNAIFNSWTRRRGRRTEGSPCLNRWALRSPRRRALRPIPRSHTPSECWTGSLRRVCGT